VADKALVIPATFKVGAELPPYLPLASGDLKPMAECTRQEVAQAVAEIKNVAHSSRERLEAAYVEHVRDMQLLAQVSAYLARFDEWAAVRSGGTVREVLWHIDERED
jgi:hypothetical protein